MKMTYDEYESLCETMESIAPEVKVEVPDRDFIRKLRMFSIQHVVGLLTFILEHLPEKLTDDEKVRVRRINQVIGDQIEFEEECEPDISFVVSGKDYTGMFQFAKSYHTLLADVTLSRDDVAKKIRPRIAYCLGFALFFLTSPCPPGKSPIRSLKNCVVKNFTLHEEENCVSISRTAYEDLLADIDSGRLDTDDWFPTEEDVREVFAPNMDVAYDFVLLLAKRGKDKKKDPKVLKLLDELLLEKVRLTGGDEMEWL